MRYIAFIAFCFVMAPVCHALDQSDVQAFFERYQRLLNAFNPDVTELYSDDASIASLRHYPNGRKRVIEMTGKQMKAMVKMMMPVARSRGDISRFSNVEIKIKDGWAKVSAERYSVMRNYTDKGYHMIVKETQGGGLLIVREYSETQPHRGNGQEPDGDTE
ncbi:MAG: hypothetical protein JW706_08605 [Opitutales bacterium]|nr:hypothetical protein [Opitutales bacterium]